MDHPNRSSRREGHRTRDDRAYNGDRKRTREGDNRRHVHQESSPPRKRRLQSAIVPIAKEENGVEEGQKLLSVVIKKEEAPKIALATDSDVRKRNMRMFGFLRGTLNTFQKEAVSDKSSELRKSLETKADERVRAEREQLKADRIRLREKRVRETKVRGDLKRKKTQLQDAELELAQWKKYRENLNLYLKTTSSGHCIYYAPAKHTVVTKALLQKQQEDSSAGTEIKEKEYRDHISELQSEVANLETEVATFEEEEKSIDQDGMEEQKEEEVETQFEDRKDHDEEQDEKRDLEDGNQSEGNDEGRSESEGEEGGEGEDEP